MIYGIILGVHVLVCILLVLVVLMQSSKGGGLAGGAFGGGAENTVFGGRGAATVLSKATTVFGFAFMFTSLTLTLMSTSRTSGPRSLIAEDAARTGGIPTQPAPTGLPLGDGSAPAGAEGGAATVPTTPGTGTPVVPAPTGDAPLADPTPADGTPGDAGAAAPAETPNSESAGG